MQVQGAPCCACQLIVKQNASLQHAHTPVARCPPCLGLGLGVSFLYGTSACLFALQVVSETVPALLALKAAGLVRHIGITGLPLGIFKYVLERVPTGARAAPRRAQSHAQSHADPTPGCSPPP